MIICNNTGGTCGELKQAGLSRTRGFTLVEIMVAVTLLSMVMASLIATFLVFSKGMASMGNYGVMSANSRNTLERFARDVHAAETLISVSANTFEFEVSADAGGFIYMYQYDATARDFKRMKYSNSGTLLATQVLFTDVADEANAFRMIFYNRLDEDVTAEASVLTEAKTVQIDAKLKKKVINQNNTDHIISARFLMRNL